MSAAGPVLAVDHLTMRFGGLVAISDLSFSARRGHITALIGPNGAGKTTVFNCMTGFYKPSQGMMRLMHATGEEFLLADGALLGGAKALEEIEGCHGRLGGWKGGVCEASVRTAWLRRSQRSARRLSSRGWVGPRSCSQSWAK